MNVISSLAKLDLAIAGMDANAVVDIGIELQKGRMPPALQRDLFDLANAIAFERIVTSILERENYAKEPAEVVPEVTPEC